MQPFSSGPDSDDDAVGRESSGLGRPGGGACGGGANWPGSWFKSGTIFNIVLYEEENWKRLEADGGREEDDRPIADGWVRLDGSVYVDTERLNREVFLPEKKQEDERVDGFREGKCSIETEERLSTTCVEGPHVFLGEKNGGNYEKIVSDGNRGDRRGTCICQ